MFFWVRAYASSITLAQSLSRWNASERLRRREQHISLIPRCEIRRTYARENEES